MKMKALLLACLLSAPCAALAQDKQDPACALSGDETLRAMQDEASRTSGLLQLDALEKPYFAAYTVWDGTTSFAEASFGALISENMGDRYRRAGAEVYVGDYQFDNSKFNFQRPAGANVPVDAGYGGVRFALWSMSDEAYKDALEAFSRKKAFRQQKALELLPDRAPAPVFKYYGPQEQALLPDETLRALVKGASAVFKNYPEVQDSRAAVWYAQETQRYLNTEGSEFLTQDSLGQAVLRAEGQAEDGFPVRAERTVFFLSASSAPSQAQFEKSAEDLGRRVAELSKSGSLDAYIGPVLLEDAAAGEFFYNLFVVNVSNPREEWLENGVDERMGQLVPKMGLRVLPAFMDVYDDPSQRLWRGQPLIGYFAVDDEGVAPRRLNLVQRGKLQDVPMSRAPIKGKAQSNGHGRGWVRQFPTGQPGNVFVSSRRESGAVLPLAKLRQRLVRLCRELDLEYGIIVRSFDDFSRSNSGYEARFSAYKIYASDGHEEPVHGLEIAGLVPSALRGIEAVSAENTVSSFLGPLPVSVVSPALLLGDVEVSRSMRKPDRKPYLRNPYFEGR